MSARRITKVALLLGSTALTFFLGEIVLRALHIAYPDLGGKLHFYTWDLNMGYALRPGARGMIYNENQVFAQINSQGLRDGEHIRQKPPDTFRIAILGDSFAEALQVPMEQAFWTILGRELAGCPALGAKQIEVINFGVSGYGTAQELQMLRYRVWDYSPDLVLLAFFTGNDVQDNSRALRRDPYRPYFVYKNGELVLDDSFRKAAGFRSRFGPFQRLLSWTVAHSRVLQVAAAARNYISQGNPDGVRVGEMGLNSAIYRDPGDQIWEDAWQVTEALIKTMHSEVVAKGAEFLVVTLSNSIQVDPDPTVRRQFMERLAVQDLFYPDHRIKQWGEREGITVFNLAPAFQQYAEKQKIWLHGFYGNRQGHWNQEGNRLAGDMIARELCQDGLVYTERTSSIKTALAKIPKTPGID